VLELAGVQNVLAKRLGSRSQLNNARVAIKALQQLRTLEEVAAQRQLPLSYLMQ
jgi:small subunit ribosomal protein S5